MDINGRWFIDSETKRTILFKGVNLSGGTKLPTGFTSHDRNGYWVDYDRKVNFIGRPFPLNEADEHFSRLVNLGFNLLRFIVTWEAVEHEGPGIYDQDYLDYVVQILKKCQQRAIHVYIDPHQDTWSRHCGGSGHPGWTLVLAGLNPLNFPDTNAAIVHNLYPVPENFPKMIWNTNYDKLAAATMFTLFFAGKTYAPKCILNDGIHIQDYLQQHYYNCFKQVATMIRENDLENTVVIGYDTMNEPGQGYLPIKDITKLKDNDVDLKVGTMPTAFQGMLLGSGVATKVENWEFKWNGPKKAGEVLVDPQGVTAWLDEQKLNEAYNVFGWKRDFNQWPIGCIWATHGVWDKSTQQVLLPEYFATEPITNEPTDYMKHWLHYLQDYSSSIRSIHSDAILFIQPPIMEIPPKLPPSLHSRIVYAPHWYDGLTLVKKKWCNYNVDFINLRRGKYGTGPLKFVRSLRLGEKAIRECFIDQLKTMQDEGLENFGEFPCILGEIGIPYDMELEVVKTSSASSSSIWGDIWNWITDLFVTLFFSTTKEKEEPSIGDPGSSQNRAMDANLNALEKNLLNYSLWNYMADNNDQWGDSWNGEDLSIWQQASSATFSFSMDLDTDVTNDSISSTSTAVTSTTDDSKKKQHLLWNNSSLLADQYLDNTSTDSLASNHELLKTSNSNNNARHIISLYRPHPRFTAGVPIHINFVSPTKSTRASFEYTYKQNIYCDGPTEIYVPACYFPAPVDENDLTRVRLSAGKYKINPINNQYWILLWWIDEATQVQEAKLNLEGISLLV